MAKFLSADGYINTPAFIELVRDIDKLAVAESLKPLEVHFSKKAIVREDHPSAARMDSAAFEKKRAQEIKVRKRPPVSGSAVRMMVLLRNYKGLDQFADYWKDYQFALKAIERHNVKALKSITSLKTAAVKKRDKLNAEFDRNIDVFINKLIGDNQSVDYVVGKSMMGKTLLVKLPNGGVVSVGKADIERFNKAVEAEESEAAPAKKTVAKTVGTKTGRTSAAKPSASAKPVSPAKRATKTVAAPVAKRAPKAAPAPVKRTAAPLAKRGAAPVKTARR